VRWLLAAALVLTVAACGDLRPGLRLGLRTNTTELLTDDCPADPIPAIRVIRGPDAEVWFVDVEAGSEIGLVWPVGFAAWDINGVAVVHASDGTVVGREGDTLANVRALDNVWPDALQVCAIGVRTYR